MFGDPKKMAMLVLAKGKPGKKDEPEEPSESPLKVAAEEMLAAVKANDADAFAEALKSAYQMCAHAPESESDDE